MAINALLEGGVGTGMAHVGGVGPLPNISHASRTCGFDAADGRHGHGTLREANTVRRPRRRHGVPPSHSEGMSAAWPATAQFLRSEILRHAEQTLTHAQARFGVRPAHHKASTASQRAARVRRRLPSPNAPASLAPIATPNHGDEAPSAALPADQSPLARIGPQWSAKKRYSISEALRALSACRSPFTHAGRLSDELHAYLETRPETEQGNHTLEQVGTVLDGAASLEPRIFLMQSVCEMARIGADVLDGERVTASDMLSVISVQRSVMGLRRARAGKRRNTQRLSSAPRAPLPKQRLQGMIKSSPFYWLSHWIHRQFGASKVSDNAPVALEARGVPGLRPDEAIQAAVPSHTSESGPSERLFDTADTIARIKTHDGNAPPGHRTLAHMAQPPAQLARGLDRQTLYGKPPPARAAVAHVENVPFIRGVDTNGELEWAFAALADYRPKPPMAAPAHAEDGGVYLIDGREFVHLEGHIYPIQFASRDEPWLVDRQSEGDRWHPPLPLERVGVERWAPAMPALRHDVGAHGARAGADGFIRIGGRRFIALAGITVEVSPPFVHNEVAIRHLAEHRQEALPEIDSEHLIRTPAGDRLLQGRYGFYPVTYDTARQRMQVGTLDEPSRFSLLYDLRTEEWHVSDNDLYFQASIHTRSESQSRSASRSDSRSESRTRSESGSGSRSGSASVSGAGSVALPLAPTTSRRASSGGSARSSISDDMPPRKESLLAVSRRLRGNLVLSRRPALRLFLAETFDAMAEMRLHRSNRRRAGLSADAQHAYPPVWIGEIRSTIYALLPDENQWQRMTVLEKQEQAALAADLAYRASGAQSLARQSAYCNEMADLLVAQMCTRAPALRGHMLQISVRDLPGTGLAHVTVLYADDPGYFGIFGALTEPGITPASLPVMGKSTLGSYLWHYREVVVVLDPWGDTKILEPDRFETKDALLDAFDENLRLAGFTVGPNRDFRVQAVIPVRH